MRHRPFTQTILAHQNLSWQPYHKKRCTPVLAVPVEEEVHQEAVLRYAKGRGFKPNFSVINNYDEFTLTVTGTPGEVVSALELTFAFDGLFDDSIAIEVKYLSV